ncbi:putative RND efflux transporter-like domain protein [Rickettsia amblyommatis str. Ac/Pa]|uniref:Putative RND efflux transporter-like domain protein n=1 Tax=Rickettsia amblyommatis str. Ac/Pa TaxID=1359164 RepID=A0A0F3N2U6_RICAM|nr:putative RND efflux transporter-like domain protein [Rickettsia amblyommatis str. Ac/Pa]
MTTIAASMRAMPITLGVGATEAERRSLGLTVVGGLLTLQLLTLYITLIICLYLETAKKWLKHSNYKAEIRNYPELKLEILMLLYGARNSFGVIPWLDHDIQQNN